MSSGNEKGLAMIVALLLTALLFLLGAGLLAISDTESAIAANDEWSEGAFLAAEAAVHAGIDQITPDPASTQLAVPTTAIGGRYEYRSGAKDDTSPQPPQPAGSVSEAGYSVGESTGYSGTQFTFELYNVSGTGTGPRNSIREVEVQVMIGPFER